MSDDKRNDTRVTARLSASQLERLDALADAGGVSRSVALRRLLDGTASVATPAVAHLHRDDLLALLEEKARGGSAPAIRELLHRADQDEQLARLRQLTT